MLGFKDKKVEVTTVTEEEVEEEEEEDFRILDQIDEYLKISICIFTCVK